MVNYRGRSYKHNVTNWTRMEVIIEAKATNHNASLQITTSKSGFVWLDQVSAMPLDTYKVYMHDGIGNAFFSFILF